MSAEPQSPSFMGLHTALQLDKLAVVTLVTLVCLQLILSREGFAQPCAGFLFGDLQLPRTEAVVRNNNNKCSDKSQITCASIVVLQIRQNCQQVSV